MNTNAKKGIVSIHGKEYMTVARRLELAHEETKIQGVKTEVLQHEPIVVIQATVNIAGIEYQGISSANPAKSIEKSNPYEVAETSAVGRALGFAGYGLIESVATADDMQRATLHTENGNLPVRDIKEDVEQSELACETCGEPAEEKKGVSKTGKNYHGIFCTSGIRQHTKWLWS